MIYFIPRQSGEGQWMFTEALVDEVRRITFVGVDEDEEIVAAHRWSVARLLRSVSEERAKGRSDDIIRRAMLNAMRHEMADRGVAEDSPRYETEFSRADRSVRACIELLPAEARDPSTGHTG